ncbi:MAG TPA: glycosyl hydrolase 53 family protein [Verrucomicrobiota bacterium]|nr:glycosyl hydrolase 53 family protein [Verrucomicrobiota bacterium]HOP97856.1 glycosyl hydrolase 53 family protein [Verrucomicrobiota bacterium]
MPSIVMKTIPALLVVACALHPVLTASGATNETRIFEKKGSSDFAFGADLSFLKQVEDRGRVFKDGTNAMPGLQIFRNHGYNWIRLRLFVEPVQMRLPNDLQYTLEMATQAKQLGFKFLLDFHYAQSWADPGKQPTPAQWTNLTHRERVEAVFEYTRDTIAAFREADVLPDMVQIGNEIAKGMLWPDGRLPQNWDNFAEYIYAGINGVDAGRGNGRRPLIMIHHDQGGSIERTKTFFDRLHSYNIPYDVIGVSYYPWWHGTPMDLRATLSFLAREYQKDVIVVETAFHWRPNGETRGRPQPFPETPEGQRDFLDEVTRIVIAVPDGRGKGVFWWEPAVTGGLGSRGFFADDGTALPVIEVFDKYTRPVLRPEED